MRKWSEAPARRTSIWKTKWIERKSEKNCFFARIRLHVIFLRLPFRWSFILRGCGIDKKSRKLHPSEKAEDRNENYILFIFHHIFPHFPISSRPPACCEYFFFGRLSQKAKFPFDVEAWVEIAIKKEAGWSFAVRRYFCRGWQGPDDENNNKLIAL